MKSSFSTSFWFLSTLGDDQLLKKLEDRRHAAEARETRLKEANSFLDDDGIMEKIFSSLTGTVDKNERSGTPHIYM